MIPLYSWKKVLYGENLYQNVFAGKTVNLFTLRLVLIKSLKKRS